MNATRITLSISLIGLAVPVSAQTALLREGDPDPTGIAGQTIFSVSNTAVNQTGGYAVTLTTSGAAGNISQVWGNLDGGPGTMLRQEQTLAGFEQNSYESFFGISADSVAYFAFSDEVGGAVDLDTVWVDDSLVAARDMMAPGTSEFYTFITRVGATQDGIPYFVARTSATQGGSTLSRGLFFGTTPTAIIQTGDMLLNLPAALTTSSVDSDYRFSSLGTNVIAPVDMDTGTSSDDGAMTINGEGLMIGGALVQESLPLPASAGGAPGENWDNFDFTGITESGDYMFTGDTDAGTSMDEIIVRNGVVWAREGDMIGGQLIQGSIEGAFLNENNQLAYIWDIETPAGNLEALFLDDALVLQEGDEVDWDGDGLPDPGVVLVDFTGSSAVTVDPTGTIYFTADVDIAGSRLEGYFSLAPDEVGSNFCMANINSTGMSASIGSAGSALLSSNDLEIICTGMPPFAFGFFITSRDQGFVANPGGSAGNLCLSGAIGRNVGGGAMSSGSSGMLSAMVDWTSIPQPTGPIPAMVGDTWNFQCWMRDSSPSGMPTSNFSDGLSVIVQ